MNFIAKHTSPLGTALDRFIAERQNEFSYSTGELSQLLRDIALAAKVINREINRAGLADISGSTGDENIHGENQEKLDAIANERFLRALLRGGQTCAIVSEESEQMIETNNTYAKYIVVMDPLDGSSNINVNVSVGTIFSIYRRQSKLGDKPSEEDYLRNGREQIAAGYVLYGSSTMLVYTTGFGVNGFTYETSLGEFFLSHPYIQMNPGGNIFSVNMGNYHVFTPAVKKYIDTCIDNQYSSRYIGSLVSDFHRNLLKGGIYLYPPTNKHKTGKLRLMYECNPIAFIAEQAGGKAIDGYQNILDIKPHYVHMCVPFYVGSENMVSMLEDHYKNLEPKN